MPSVVGRDAELATIDAFLATMVGSPSALTLAGEAGIGKSTLWQATVEAARGRGYQVLSCRPVVAEVRLGYAALGDLLAGVDPSLVDALPVPQRRALDAALVRGSDPAAHPDPRAVAAGLLSVVNRLAMDRPLLLAVDDVQWTDSSSAIVVAFAVRRLSGPVGVLTALRTGDGPSLPFPLADGDRQRRIEVGPLRMAAIHQLLSARLGRSLPRSALVRITAAAAGNPFYALELARDDRGASGGSALPARLADLIDARIGRLPVRVREVLLAASALADPTVPVLTRAVERGDLVELLGVAEDAGIIELSANRVRFTHPLLAQAAYLAASPRRRRDVHRALSEVVDRIEERARHLALAAVGPDPQVLSILDAAITSLLARGAPAAAAELGELGLRLGDADPDRQLRLARCHVFSGDLTRAETLLTDVLPQLTARSARVEALVLLGDLRATIDDFDAAIAALEQALVEAGDQAPARLQVVPMLCFVLTIAGRLRDALPYALAGVDAATRVGAPAQLASALAVSVIARNMLGDPLDEPTLARAIALEDRAALIPIPQQPSCIAALCWMFAGRFDAAERAMAEVETWGRQLGYDAPTVGLSFWRVQIQCWRGDLAAAQQFADDAVDNAATQDAVSAVAGRLGHALVHAWRGNAAEASSLATHALEQLKTIRTFTLWVHSTVALAELSTGNHAAAAAAANTALTVMRASGIDHPMIAPFLPDLAEALIALGDLDAAEPHIEWLEERGHTLDHAWSRAVGARCRGLLHAARGDVDAALEALDLALTYHARVEMPLERARSLLVCGRLHRRAKHKTLARSLLTEAHLVFGSAGAAVWAARAREELDRVNIRPAAPQELTPTEVRIAELAAAGRTNREIAAAVCVAEKTVEANLARAFRKLGITGRAQLGTRLAERAARTHT